MKLINKLYVSCVLPFLLTTVSVSSQCAIPSLIPNSDFETQFSCPNASGQIGKATGWQAASSSLADYYNCGFSNIGTTYEAPPTSSSGTGYIGLSNQSTGNKQYAKSCLSSSLIAGLPYTFQFDIASANGSSSSLFNGSTSNANYTMVLYGNMSCPVAPYNGNSCPSPSDGWQVLTTINVTANGNTWTTANAEFIPNANYQSIAIGPDCNTAASNAGLCSGGLCYNYYYLDNLILNLTSLYPTVEVGTDVINDCTTPSNGLQATISGGTPGYTYDWQPALGLSSPNISNPIADPSITTDYIVTITDANGCDDKDTVRVTIDKTPPTANAGTDKTIDCANETVVLTATGGTSYSWSPGTGLSSTSVANPTSSATVTTNYTVTVTGDNGCSDTDEVLVTVDKDLPIVTTGPDVTTDCDFPDAQLSATGGGTYKWTPNIGLSNQNISNPTARPPSTTSYTVTVTAPNGCKETGSISVTINTPTPIAQAGVNKSLCGQYDVNLAPDISTQLPIDTYLWTSSPNNPTVAVFSDDTIQNSNVSNLIEGTYKLYWTVTNNVCPPVTDSVYISVFDVPTSDAGEDDSLCAIYNTQLNANVPLGSAVGKWSLQSNFPNPNPGAVQFTDINSPNTSVSGLQEGVYHLIWTVTNGNCAAKRDTVYISIFDEPIAFAGIDDSLCSQYQVNLSATPAAGTSSGLWTDVLLTNPSSVTFANDISPVTNVSDLIEGTYELVWTVSNGSCTNAIDTVKVNVYDAPVSNAGVSSSVCGYDSLNLDTLFFLNSNDPIGTSSGVWTIDTSYPNPSIPVFLDDTNYMSGVTNLLEGDYKFVWTVDNGNCSAESDFIIISAFDKPIANAGLDQELCAEYSIDFTALPTNGTSTAEWSTVSNWVNPSVVLIDDTLDPTSPSSGYIEGVYKFVWIVSNGNCSSIADTVVFTIYDTPLADAGPDVEMCASSNTILDAIDPIGTASGIWTQDFSFNSTSAIDFDDDTLNITNSLNYTEGTYRLIWTVSNGVCEEDKDSMLVSTYNMPIANAGFDQYNCDLDTVLLNGSGNVGTASGEWILDPNYPYPSIPILRDSSNESSIADNLIVGDYSMIWVIENGVCPSDTDSVVIFNMERPVAIANYETQQCDNKCFDLTSLSTAPAGDGLLANWKINGQDYFDSIPEICIAIDGDYEVRLIVTASNGCVDSLINYPMINVKPSPEAAFVLNYETDTLIELQRVDVEDLSSNDVIYYWYAMGNTDTITDESDFIYFYNDFGDYKVTQWVENQFGCRDSISHMQKVLKRKNIFVPNTFTPNSDGVNDLFIPISRDIPSEEYEFAIFNRWGTMIFRTTTPNVGWDGTYKGEVVKDEAYVWKIQYKPALNQETQEEQGHVMVYKFSR
jgi:gliding motility-associated-like protein